MASLIENTQRIINALKDIKAAIIRKGVTPTGKCETFADAIDNIFVGVDVSDTTAAEEHVLYGKVFHKADGNKVNGSMPDNAAVSKTLDATTTSYTVPEGYHNGNGSVAIYPQTKVVTSSPTTQTVYPDNGRVLTEVTVNGMPTQTKSVTPTESEQTVYPDLGYLLSAVTVDAVPAAKVASGTFTANDINGTQITLPFAPTKVAVMVVYNKYIQCDMYVSELGVSKGATGSTSTAGGTIEGILGVNANTFIHRVKNGTLANKTAYYIAVG